MASSLDGLTTVITPAFNSADHIRNAVASVLAQTVTPLEHIVIDDGSLDGTAEIVEELRSAHPWLRLVQQQNAGAAVARNNGIEKSRGRYIAFLDADDVWDPQKLEAQLSFMVANDAAFTFGDYIIADRTRGTLRITDSPETVSHDDLLRGCPIGCLTVALDKDKLRDVRMPLVRQGQDWGLWLKLTRRGVTARKYPGVHATYFTGGASLSRNKIRKLASVYSIYRHEEGLGPVRSATLLAQHSLSSIIKKI